MLDVRALGSDSSPVTDLTAAHFAVSVDGRKAIVESATDRARVQETLGVGVFTGTPPALASLRAEPQRNALSASEASATSTIEESLIQLGRVLEDLRGAKNLLLVGYGLGTWIPRLDLVQMPTAYPAALDALRRARVSAFCIDITRADYHPREEGLVRVATESGGLYWQSHIFTASVFEKLEKVVTGRYVLSIVPPDDRRGEHTIRIRLVGRKGQVLAPRQYIQN